jgi:hypothetical protein
VAVAHACNLISKLILKGFLNISPLWVYFILSSQPLQLLSFTPLPPITHCSTAFNRYPYILYLSRCCVLWYCWHSIIPFSFLSFPQFHNVVILLQTCSTYIFVYDHVSFHVHVYSLDLSSAYERKHAAFIFLNLT